MLLLLLLGFSAACQFCPLGTPDLTTTHPFEQVETFIIGDRKVSLSTSILEEKGTACAMLCCYAEELGEGFYPYVEQARTSCLHWHIRTKGRMSASHRAGPHRSLSSWCPSSSSTSTTRHGRLQHRWAVRHWHSYGCTATLSLASPGCSTLAVVAGTAPLSTTGDQEGHGEDEAAAAKRWPVCTHELTVLHCHIKSVPRAPILPSCATC